MKSAFRCLTMINITNKIIRKQKNFWNNCIFHPTDAIEDPWGRRILDRIADDGAIDTLRIYAMLEDIVYLGENGEIKYDFRLSDTRLDYLVEKGYNLLIAYGGIPDCIAKSSDYKTSASKNKTRYKGKMWNSMPPKDYSVWENVCYEYTKHIVERYGIEVVSKWYLHCFNEPDIPAFFLSNLPDGKDGIEARLSAYCPMYEGFAKGVLKADERLRIGGPALAGRCEFLKGFLEFVKQKNIRIDYIALHNYGTSPELLLNGTRPYDVENNMENHLLYLDVIKKAGFSDCEIVVDEWGMASCGFWNVEECPPFIARENEVYSAYYTKLISKFIEVDPKLSKLMICLSGQHEMTEDFSGFRNFFTLNHFAKPIYNAHYMASKLENNLIEYRADNENLAVIPTKSDEGEYAVMISYSSKNFEENIPECEEYVTFDEHLFGRRLLVFLIDKKTTNPYRLAEKMGVRYPDEEQKKILREEGRLKAIIDEKYDGKLIKIKLTPNSTYLIQVV